ncbi:MAG: SDR family oxidoreductase [Oscillospiraceae bacterium]|jgi:NAD(P)-dependent dehydrogenase (short-subunit alcohol dehydrogenase family)|nr:SDR family oxidoreductase [Oscillospiraceae bacterium]
MIEAMKDAFALTGKNAIVTGGNRGIGLGIVQAFAQQGANVAIFARDAKAAQAVLDELTAQYPGGKFAFYATDISGTENCKTSVEAFVRDFGGIDILVNNSGIGPIGGLLDMPEDLSPWTTCLDIDLTGALRMCYFVGRHMRARGKGGRIINISSNAGSLVNKPQILSAYSVAKAGINMLTKNLAVEMGPFGVTVNAIAPGFTWTAFMNLMSEPERKENTAKMPVGRFGTALEIGALATYLASEASEMVTGMICTIDGGYSLAV